jgi:hypothetical protein
VAGVPKPLEKSLDDLARVLQDVAYVSVGLGLMAFQKAQVQRQELKRSLEGRLGGARSTVGDNLKVVEERLRAVTDR